MDRLKPKDFGKVVTVALILLSTACGDGGDGSGNKKTTQDNSVSSSLQLVCQTDPGETYVPKSQNLKEGDSVSVQNGSKTVVSARSIQNNQIAVRFQTCVYQ